MTHLIRSQGQQLVFDIEVTIGLNTHLSAALWPTRRIERPSSSGSTQHFETKLCQQLSERLPATLFVIIHSKMRR